MESALIPARLLWSGKTSQEFNLLKSVGTLDLRECSPTFDLVIGIRARVSGAFLSP